MMMNENYTKGYHNSLIEFYHKLVLCLITYAQCDGYSVIKVMRRPWIVIRYDLEGQLFRLKRILR